MTDDIVIPLGVADALPGIEYDGPSEDIADVSTSDEKVPADDTEWEL